MEPTLTAPMNHGQYGHSSRFALGVAAATAVGALLRVLYQSGRSFVGDEIGTLQLIEEPYRELLSSFRTWLTMNYFLVTEKFLSEWLGSERWVLVAVPLIAGVVTIPLSALLARRYLGPASGITCATLVAVHPELIKRSVEIRSYSLLIGLTLASLLAFESWRTFPSWSRGSTYAAIALVLLLAHPNGAYPTAAVLALVFLDVWMRRDADRPPSHLLNMASTILVPSAVALFMAAGAYAAIYPKMKEVGWIFRSTPPTSIGYLADAWAYFFGHGFWSWPTLALFAFGAWRSLHRRRRHLGLLVVLATGPLLMSLQGMAIYPWAMARYLIFTIPVILLLVVAGLEDLASDGSEWFRKIRPATPTLGTRMIAVGVLVLIASWTPGLVKLFEDKSANPWRDLRATLSELPAPVRVLGLSFIDALHMDPRPEQYPLTTGRLQQLRPTDKSSSATTVLVGRELEFKCAGAARSGRIGYVVMPTGSERLVAEHAYECLLGTVQGHWPVAAHYLDVYENLLRLTQRLGKNSNVRRLVELREASRMLVRSQIANPPRRLERQAQAVSERWRRHEQNTRSTP